MNNKQKLVVIQEKISVLKALKPEVENFSAIERISDRFDAYNAAWDSWYHSASGKLATLEAAEKFLLGMIAVDEALELSVF